MAKLDDRLNKYRTSSETSVENRLARYRGNNEISPTEEKKSLIKTGSAGLQYFGQGILKGLEGTFVDTPLWIASNVKKAFGDDEGAEALAEASRISLTNMLINAAAGEETNPYMNQNQNLWNREVDEGSYIKEDNLGGKVLTGIGEMMPTIAIGGAMKGSPLTRQIGANTMLGTKAFSSAANQAFEESGDITRSSLYGLVNTGIELATEQIAGGIPGLKQIKGDIGGSLLKNYVKDVAGEGLEEIIAELTNPLAQTIYKGGDALSQYGNLDYWKGVAEAGLVGSITGGILSSPNLVTNNSKGKSLPSKVEIQQSEISDDISKVSAKKAGQEGTLVTQPTVEADTDVEVENEVDTTPIVEAKVETQTEPTIETKSIKDNTELYNKVNNEKQLVHLTNDLLNIVNNKSMDGKKLSVAVQNKGAKYVGYGQQAIKFKPEILDHVDTNKLFKGDGATNHQFAKESTNKFESLEELINDNPKYYNEILFNDDIPLDLIEEVTIPKNSSPEIISELENAGIKINYYNAPQSYNTTKDVVVEQKQETKKPKTVTEKQTTKKQEIKQKPVMEQIKNVDEFAAPSDDAIDKAIDKKIKADEKAKKQSINKPAEKKTFTKEEMDNRKKFLEAKSNTFDREISRYRTDSKKLNEWLEGTIKVYDKYISDGGEAIPAYDDLAIKHHVRKTTENITVPKDKELFTKNLKDTIKQIDTQTEQLNTESISGNNILDEQLNLNEQYEFDDTVIVVQSNDSRINDTYNEKQNKLKEAKKSLNKADVDLDEYMEIQTVKDNYDQSLSRKENVKNNTWTYLKQKLIDQYASIRDLDKQTKSYTVENALLQSLNANSLANTGINGEYIIDDQYKPTNIPSISKVFKPLIDMGQNNYRAAQQYILLQMDYFNKVNDMKYNEDIDDGYVNNIFPSKTPDDLLAEISLIEESNPDLVSFIDDNIIPNVRRITRALNQMEIRAGTRNARTNVTVEFAKNEMNLTDEYIKNNKTKNGYVNVDTVDYWSAANPWYIPIARETGTQNTGVSKKTDRAISKPKNRKEGAEVYDIQPLADGFAEKYLTRMSNIQQNKLRVAIANATEQINGVTAQAYKTKQGETSFITTVGDGQTQLRYLTNDQYGNLVNKVVAINKNIADAYNGLSPMVTSFKDTTPGKILNTISTARKSVLTKYNIPWQIKNVVVDFGDAIINNEFGARGNALLIKNEMGALFRDSKNNDPIYKEFMAFKGEYLTKTKEKGFVQEKPKGIKGTLAKLDNALQTGELLTRYAVYKTARQQGYDIADAQRLSNSSTTDFNKTGLLLKAADTSGATVFLGTSMAGANRFYDSLIAPTVDAATLVYKTAKQQGLGAALNKSTYDAYDQRTLNRFIGQSIKTSLIFGLGRMMLKELFDDEEKQQAIANLSDSEIRDNICIPLDNGNILKIPKGRVWRSMDAIQDVLTDSTIRDTDKMGVIDTFKYVMDNVGVNNLEDSLTISTTMDIIKNKDYFDNEIYDVKGSSEEQRKAIADYYAKQYGSWIYKAVKYANGGTEVNPFVSTFYTDTTTVQSYNNRFFNMKDAYENSDDITESFKFKVANYEKTYGELGTELKKLKTIKNDSFSTTEQIREQEDKVKALYNDLFTYLDSNDVVDMGNEIRIGTNYTYIKQSDGSYKKKAKK